MKLIRIGNDIRIEWPIVLSGDVDKLQDLDLTVEVRPSAKIIDTHNYADAPKPRKVTVMMNGGITCRPDIGDGKEHCRPRPCPPHNHRPVPPAPVRLPYHIEDNTLIAMWTADRQFATGDYDIILYAHKNEGGQAVCDQYRFVRLVSHTAQADAPDDSGIEAVIAMQPVTLELSGLSAYEVAVINGFTGTEKEWLASLKKPAEDAAEQAKKDLEQFKTETKAEVKQDITNLNANTGVDEYEEFSSTKPYNAGDFVKYNGLIYKFAYAHQGAWTGTDVAQYSISKEIKELISEGWLYIGRASVTTSPSTPKGKVFYVALESGTYTHFSNITVNQGEVALLVWDGTSSWVKSVLYNIPSVAYFKNSPTSNPRFVRELYLKGLNSGTTYSFNIYKDTTYNIAYLQVFTGTSAVADKLVAQGAVSLLDNSRSLFELKEANNSGISGYIVLVNLSAAPNSTVVEQIDNDIAGNAENSPIIGLYLNGIGGQNVVEITVGAGKDFTSLKAAIDSITDSSERKIYNVYLYPGTYNMVSDFYPSGDYSAAKEGLVLPDYVNLIGRGNFDKIIVTAEFPSSVPQATSEQFSAINLKHNNEVRNITFKAKNCRYACHDESANTYKNWKRVVDNCVFWHEGVDKTDGTLWQWCDGYGQGLSDGAECVFTNCTFRTDVNINGNAGFITHDNTNFLKSCSLRFENCTFKNTAYPLCFRAGTLGSGVDNIVTFNGCQFVGTGDGDTIEQKVEGSGHEGRTYDFFIKGYSNTGANPIYDETAQIDIIENGSSESSDITDLISNAANINVSIERIRNNMYYSDAAGTFGYQEGFKINTYRILNSITQLSVYGYFGAAIYTLFRKDDNSIISGINTLQPYTWNVLTIPTDTAIIEISYRYKDANGSPDAFVLDDKISSLAFSDYKDIVYPYEIKRGKYLTAGAVNTIGTLNSYAIFKYKIPTGATKVYIHKLYITFGAAAVTRTETTNAQLFIGIDGDYPEEMVLKDREFTLPSDAEELWISSYYPLGLPQIDFDTTLPNNDTLTKSKAKYIETSPWYPLQKLKKVTFIPIYGQSHATGGEATPVISNLTKYNNMFMFNDGAIYANGGTSFLPLVEADVETPCSGTAEGFLSSAKVEDGISPYDKQWMEHYFVVTTPGEGGQGIDYLSNDRYYIFQYSMTRCKTICDAMGVEVDCPAWIWLHGSNDLANGMSGNEYKTKLIALHEKVNSDLKSRLGIDHDVPCIIYQDSTQGLYTLDQGYDNDQLRIATAQMELVRDRDDFSSCNPTYIYDTKETYKIHFTSVSSKLLGAYCGIALKHIALDGQKHRAVLPTAVTKDGNNLVLAMDVPCPPLVIDIQEVYPVSNYGFSVISQSGEELINKVEVWNTTITIYCKSDPTGAKLRYGLGGVSPRSPILTDHPGDSGRQYGSRGNIRDSQGQFLFLDIEGHKYPLSNWMWAFERTI